MSYTRELLQAEQRNKDALLPLYREYDAMSRLQKIRHLGTAVRLSAQIAELEGMIRARRELFDFSAHDTRGTSTDDATTEALIT